MLVFTILSQDMGQLNIKEMVYCSEHNHVLENCNWPTFNSSHTTEAKLVIVVHLRTSLRTK